MTGNNEAPRDSNRYLPSICSDSKCFYFQHLIQFL